MTLRANGVHSAAQSRNDDASKRKAMSYGRMLNEEARLKEEIQRLLDNASAVDAEEDERYGEQMRGDELPAELERSEKRLAAIQEAKARLPALGHPRDGRYLALAPHPRTDSHEPSCVREGSPPGYRRQGGVKARSRTHTRCIERTR